MHSRRSLLRKSAVFAGSCGVLGMASSRVQAADLPHSVTLSNGSDDEYMYYEISVTGDIAAGSNTEAADDDNGSRVAGTVDSGDNLDDWSYSGYVTEVYVAGTGDVSFYTSGDESTPEYKVDIFTEYDANQASYNWSQDGYIYERDDSLEGNDSISSDNAEAHGNITDSQDSFLARGYPSYLYLDSNDKNIRWRAYDF